MPTKSVISSIRAQIRNVVDFPKPGINYKDITPLLKEPTLLKEAAQLMAHPFKDKKIDYVVCLESRGFIFGSLIASILDAGIVPVRKPDKLPYSTFSQVYSTEYSNSNVLHIHKDALSTKRKKYQNHDDGASKRVKVLIHDDLLATGGSIWATTQLVKKFDAIVSGYSFLVELSFLNARKKIFNFLQSNHMMEDNFKIFSLIIYELEK